MLAHDKVGRPELVHILLTLMISNELTVLAKASSDGVLLLDVCHLYLFFCQTI